MPLPDPTDALVIEQRAVDSLHPDPANSVLFDGMDEEELQGLAASLKEYGFLHPLNIRADGSIIAGEQRWKAAKLAGLTHVPVIVRDTSDEDAEVLRIEENIRRQTIRPSVEARATRRLKDISGIKRGRPSLNSSLSDELKGAPGAPFSPALTMKDIAEQTGVSERQAKTLSRLDDLIPTFKALLDAGKITQKTAYQLAQLPAEDQEAIAASWQPTTLQSDKEAKELKDKLKELNRRIAELQRPVADPEKDEALARLAALEKELATQRASAQSTTAHDLAAKEGEIAALQSRIRTQDTKHAAEVTRLENEKRRLAEGLRERHDFVERHRKEDAVYLALAALRAVMLLDPLETAQRLRGVSGMEGFLSEERTKATAAAVWLTNYAAAIDEVLNTSGELSIVR